MFVKLRSQKGYTLVEVLLAMAIFTFVMLVILGSLNGLYRIYRASVGIRDTQQQARLITEEITRATRNASYVVAGTNSICLFYSASRVNTFIQVPSDMYTVEGTPPLDSRLVKRHAANALLALDGSTQCNPANVAYGPGQDLTSNEVSVALFEPSAASIVAPVTLNSMLNFHLRIASRRALANELVNPPVPFDPDNPDTTGPMCDEGESFCSMTSITSGVQARSLISGDH